MAWQPMWVAVTYSPAGAAASSLVDYVLSYGVLGVFTVMAAIVLWKGLLIPTRKAEADKDAAVTLARADLLREIERLAAEKKQAEDQRDELQRLATDQLVPMLVSFTASTQSLLPLLQDLVRMGEAGTDEHGPGRSRR